MCLIYVSHVPIAIRRDPYHLELSQEIIWNNGFRFAKIIEKQEERLRDLLNVACSG
jgi:hypothetical protein